MSSSDEDENPLVRFGTALEEPDDTEPVKKPVAVHEQIVTDSEGRRRFHGAFTGGFSAGYYNTVDTKDGWTPTTFRSSRKDRTTNKSFAPEDFMDDEDMSEHGIAPKRIVMQSSFSSNKGPRPAGAKEKFAKNATMLLGMDMLQSLVIPVSNNVGVKLLQKMGWKPGQGIGPKVKRRKKSDFIPEHVTFAPEDTVPMSFSPKENIHGLGYSGMDPTLALHAKHKKSSAISVRTKSGAKLSFAGQAFGVGAYEDEDQDIYAQDSMANYDLVMGEEKQDDAYGWSRPTKAITGPKDMQAITFIKKVLEGFKKAERSVQRKLYPPPKLPHDFDPNKRLKLLQGVKVTKGFPAEHPGFQPPVEKNPYDRLDPDQRRQLLEGEQKPKYGLDNVPKSIFDLMLPKDRRRFEKLKSGEDQPPEKTDKEKKKSNFYEPFATDQAKQMRYKQYLSVLKERKTDPYSHIEHDPHMTEWEIQQEQEEFAKSSRFFQPLSATMSSRFAPESNAMKEQDEKEKALKNAAKMKLFGIMTRESSEWHPDPLLCKRFNVPNPYPHSEIVGVPGDGDEPKEMFLDPKDFIRKKPSKPPEIKSLTCEAQSAGGKILSDTKNPPTFRNIKNINKSSRWDEEPALQGPAPRAEEAEPWPEEEEKIVESEKETENGDGSADNVPKTAERPSMDLFKAIFASSDEESSDEEEDDEDEEPVHPITAKPVSKSNEHAPTPTDHQIKPSNGQDGAEATPSIDFKTLTKPGFHKFSLKSKRDTSASASQDDETDTSSKPSAAPDDGADMFGPSLPPPAKLSKLWMTTGPETLKGKSKKSKKKHKHKKEKKAKKHRK